MNTPKIETKKFPTDVYLVKKYLEENCVGKENIKAFTEIQSDIIYLYGGNVINHCRFKKIIQTLRTNFDRKICSTSQGYYLPLDASEESSYLLSMTITHIKTLLGYGVDKKILYDVINHTPSNNVQDGQQKLKVSQYAKEEVTRYSGTKQND